MYVIGYPLEALVRILDGLLFIYSIIIIASAVVSWLRPSPNHPAARILNMLTLPLYIRLRRYVPRAGYIDLTPLAALLGIMFIRMGILPIFYTFAERLTQG